MKTGVVDEAVEAPEMAGGESDEVLDLFWIAHIAHAMHVSLRQRLSHMVGSRCTAHHLRALAQERHRGGEPYASGRAGDDGNPAVHLRGRHAL